METLSLSLLLTSEYRWLADKTHVDCCKTLHMPGLGLSEAGVDPATSQRDKAAAPTITFQQSGRQRPANLFLKIKCNILKHCGLCKT